MKFIVKCIIPHHEGKKFSVLKSGKIFIDYGIFELGHESSVDE